MKFPRFSLGKDWDDLKEFEKLDIKAKEIVFYAENIASMNHFKLLLNELTENYSFNICYVTSVENDPLLSQSNSKIKSFFIGKKTARTKFFLTLKTKILIMDMPDLETFHIKKSKTYPVHYIYVFHSMFSIHSYLRKGAIDNYDTIFCVGDHHVKEIQETEKFYKLKPKNLVKYGFSRLDHLIEKNENFEHKIDNKTIIIAPSYGEDNLLQKYGIDLISILINDYKVLLRPHHKILSESKDLIKEITDTFSNNPNFEFETGIIPFDKLYNSLTMVSDWSGIAIEYAFTFNRKVIFIDVPKKIQNSESKNISIEPIEIKLREEIGYLINPNNLNKISSILNNPNSFIDDKKIIQTIRDNVVFNISKSAFIGAKEIEKLLEKL